MNISEIADLAGVSKAAVSRYFNNGYISEEKKEKIRKVIEQTGYQPSREARTLRTRKTNLIGVIIPKINSHAVSRMVAGISSIISKSDYQMILANTENNAKKELDYLKIFNQKQVDGIVLIATMFSTEHKKVLKNLTVPIVIVGQKLEGYQCVYHDDYHAAYRLTEKMIENGRKQIGYIGVTTEDIAVGFERKRGYQKALKKYGIPEDKSRMMQVSFSMEEGYIKAKELLDNVPDLDGLFCSTDNIAIGAMKAIKESGKKIPDDIEIGGMGDSMMAKVTTPSLTSIHFYYKTSGEEAAKMLLTEIEGESVIAKEIKMGYKLMERDSMKNSKKV
ncbi:LacI family DNA-binding transcriptional regulator [Anaerosacchariphilus polymeriproducens]|uniref:LacI family transcriptional regulator n=1 Tax=Anaerosacchariphilus polymeriproducens TaxID=1812858 RepID=A0A371ATL9_9FIRM|nr:LacI family DNA-binding transcriptional regulator [Anaerosacchariphilus polymeriproducens]RDU22915.1 LacI family transcriptional regulator [Anaerosacchariphilus polymeriproducens]